jgi:hypothetical protein
VLDLSCVQYVIKDRGETAQLPKRRDVQFHVEPPVAKRLSAIELTDPKARLPLDMPPMMIGTFEL